jgi:hypothetical protein
VVGVGASCPNCVRTLEAAAPQGAGAWWASWSDLVVWCLLSIFSPFIPFDPSNLVSVPPFAFEPASLSVQVGGTAVHVEPPYTPTDSPRGFSQ